MSLNLREIRPKLIAKKDLGSAPYLHSNVANDNPRTCTAKYNKEQIKLFNHIQFP